MGRLAGFVYTFVSVVIAVAPVGLCFGFWEGRKGGVACLCFVFVTLWICAVLLCFVSCFRVVMFSCLHVFVFLCFLCFRVFVSCFCVLVFIVWFCVFIWLCYTNS